MNKLLLSASVLFTALGWAPQQRSTVPFSMNGWQFHERDVPNLAEAVKKAPEYDLNALWKKNGRILEQTVRLTEVGKN